MCEWVYESIEKNTQFRVVDKVEWAKYLVSSNVQSFPIVFINM